MRFSPVLMHIPDGYLSIITAVILWVAAALALAIALKRVGKDLGERQLPLMGVLAAAVFAGQMLNFPVAGGTSGHLMGAALATILLGPWAAIIVLTTVVGIQALIFQDGGLVVMGANIFNMGVIGVLVSYFAYRTFLRISRGRRWGVFAGGFTAAWLSVFITSLAVALELVVSGRSPADLAIPAMGGVHMLIGLGEGLITLGTLAFLYATRRDLIGMEKPAPKGGIPLWAGGLLIAILLAVLSPLASANPDGLEWFAEESGFAGSGQAPVLSIIPDYIFPGISNEALATILAGIVGLLIVFFVTLSVARLRRKKQP